jgi:hypothetical protein
MEVTEQASTVAFKVDIAVTLRLNVESSINIVDGLKI